MLLPLHGRYAASFVYTSRACRLWLPSRQVATCRFVHVPMVWEGSESPSMQYRACSSGRSKTVGKIDDQTSNGTLALLDGTYVVIRLHAANSKNRLQNREGKSTGTVYQFSKLLIKLRQTCTHMAVVFDTGGVEQLHRSKFLPEYKGRRLELPWMHASEGHLSLEKEFEEQMLHCRSACEAFGISIRERVGYEADDIIATYAREAQKDHKVKILTGDKDLTQLVGPNVHLQSTVGCSRDLILDADGVEQRYGVVPRLMGDLLSLAGDNSDNVPGVPGIGPRKAAALLKRYGSLEAVVKAAESGQVDVRGIGHALCQSLRDNISRVRRMRQHIIELENVPCIDPSEFRESFRLRELDELALQFCREYDFRSLILRLQNDRYGTSRAMKALSVDPVESSNDFRSPLDSQAKAVSVQNEIDDSHCQGVPSEQFMKGQLSAELGIQQVQVISNENDLAMALECLAQSPKEQVFAITLRDSKDSKRSSSKGEANTTQELSIALFCGEGVDLGNGRQYLLLNCPRKRSDPSRHIADKFFERFFLNRRYKKVFHDYSSCHRLFQEYGLTQADGLRCVPHVGDTMHMARLLDPSLAYFDEGDYSIGFLRRHVLGIDSLVKYDDSTKDWKDRKMLAGCAAAIVTFNLWHTLKRKLQRKPWVTPCQIGPKLLPERSMWDFYCTYWLSFGKLLVEMESIGVPVDKARLEILAESAASRQRDLENEFRNWARVRLERTHGKVAVEGSNIDLMNLNSTTQLRQLFFGCPQSGHVEFSGVQSLECLDGDVTDEPIINRSGSGDGRRTKEELYGMTVKNLKHECKLRSLSQDGKKDDLIKRILDRQFEELFSKTLNELRLICKQGRLKLGGTKVELVDRILDPSQQARRQKSPPRLKVRLHGLGIVPVKGYTTKNRAPSVSAEALKAMIDERCDELGRDGMKAIEVLLQIVEVEAALSGFIQPLQKALHSDGRVRPCLNINTETGRLSCRNPNLQNLPVGGTFPVRNAFVASEKHSFIIADYAQLELRVVAQLADCETMMKILNSGQDIHSWTAYEMFDHIRSAVDSNKVLLSGSSRSTQSPLVKDVYPDERRQAKTLNFGVLYGMSAHTLAKEWSMTSHQSKAFIDKWFAAFPAIKAWKSCVESSDGAEGVQTLLGRRRPLRDLDSSTNRLRGHARRAAVNTPVQGGAADIVISAMLRLRESPVLQRLKYRQILQIHDEVILEGPELHAEEALKEVVQIMENPFAGQSLPFEMKVKLRVDARQAKAWRE